MVEYYVVDMISGRTSIVWNEAVVFPDCSTVIQGATRLVIGASRLVTSASRYSHMCHTFSRAVRGVPKPITITPIVHLY